MEQAELKSLHMLLKHHLWSAAIMLVQQQDPDVRGRHLFEPLISAAAKVRTSSSTPTQYSLIETNVSIDCHQWRIQDFPEGVVSTPEGKCQSIVFQNCYQKLHENERNWTERGMRVPSDSVKACLHRASATTL